METVEITFKAKVKDIEELKKAVHHHIEYLIDLEQWPEIECIYGAEIRELKEEKDE